MPAYLKSMEWRCLCKISTVLVAKVVLILYLCTVTNYFIIMLIVSARDFRANQGKYFSLANSGEHVILKSRTGSFRLTPITSEDSISEGKQNVAAELKGALQELKEAIAGKRQLQTLDSLIDEL